MPRTELDVTSWDALPVVLTVKQAAEILGMGLRQTYELAHLEGFPARRFGRSVRISRDGLRRWMEGSTSDEHALVR
ncbi:MAG: helix-turn-helix domain-containing protein [Alicyclobacillus sp.]|nr:helix-turn-helix domain-containing protein [Alicyclobacillus sp.]